ncbi:unnamed protein product [Blepharisma stoltei]|uniref:Uncharacterized protein n=1 Tax=Blepharisma stoltei TaxID=1481888 RepID=A0AAU9I9I3_9CILI|nr:unnamed protein product [Blepharisma stoltei]
MSIKVENSDKKNQITPTLQPPGDIVLELFQKYPLYISKTVRKTYSTLGPFSADQIGLGPSCKTGETFDGVFSGTVDPDTETGFGVMLYKTGEIFEGFFRQMSPMGQGRFIDSNGTAYEGEWNGKILVGHAKINWSNGKSYEGSVKDKIPHGRGTEISSRGKYVGEFSNGVKKGYGEFTYADGSIYKGNFKNDNRSDKGLFIWPDGRQYEGEWLNEMMNGTGHLIWPKEKTYRGNFSKGKIHGFGTMQWIDGKIYKGLWENDKMHGKGELAQPGKPSIVGIWRDGKLINEIKSEKSSLSVSKASEEQSKALSESDEELLVSLSQSKPKKSITSKAKGVFQDTSSSDSKPKISIGEFQQREGEESISFHSEDIKGGDLFRGPGTLEFLTNKKEDSIFDPEGKSKPQPEVKMQTLDGDSSSFEIKIPQVLHPRDFDGLKASKVKAPELLIKPKAEIELPNSSINQSQRSSVNDSKVNIRTPIKPKDIKAEIDSKRSSVQSSFREEALENKPDKGSMASSKKEAAEIEKSPAKKKERKITGPQIKVDTSSSAQSESFSQSDLKETKKIPKKGETVNTKNEEALKVSVDLDSEKDYPEYMPSLNLPKNTFSSINVKKYKSAGEEPPVDLDKLLEQLSRKKDLPSNQSLNSSQISADIRSSISRDVEESKDELEESKEEQRSVSELSESMSFNIAAKEPSYINISKERHKGRLDKIMVDSSDESGENSFVEDQLVDLYLAERKLEGLASPLKRNNCPTTDYQQMSIEDVLEEFDFFDIPKISDISERYYMLLVGMRESLGKFVYYDKDIKKTKRSKYFTDWVECKKGLYYKGQLTRKGKRHGIGMELTVNHLYEGFWRDNKRCGLGRVITIRGDVFEGRWVLDMKLGFGSLWKTNGVGYVGDWEYDLYHGKGTEVTGKWTYEGDFQSGVRHGKGRLELEDGSIYNGEFFEDEPHGYGVLTWPNGSAYAGIFIHGEIKGNKGIKIPNYFAKELNEETKGKTSTIKSELLEDEEESSEDETTSAKPPIHSPFSKPKVKKVKPPIDTKPFEGKYYGIPKTTNDGESEEETKKQESLVSFPDDPDKSPYFNEIQRKFTNAQSPVQRKFSQDLQAPARQKTSQDIQAPDKVQINPLQLNLQGSKSPLSIENLSQAELSPSQRSENQGGESSPLITVRNLPSPESGVKGILKQDGSPKKGIKITLIVPEQPELTEAEIKRRKELFKKAQLKDKKPSKEQINRLKSQEDWE